MKIILLFFFFFSSRRRHTRWNCDWSSDVCSSDLDGANVEVTRVTGDRHAEMRVYERGSGPTRSCGTGAVAAAVAAAIASAAPGTGTGIAVIPDAANGT